MSRQLIDRNPDLKRLWEEGYDIEIRSGHLLVKSIPYLNSDRELQRGALVAPLGDMSGDRLQPPSDHTIFFVGDHPCDAQGHEISQIKHSSQKQTLAGGISVDHMFSAKPRQNGRYGDYHHKMVTYVSLVSGPASRVDPSATAQTCAAVAPSDPESPFNYEDTSSSRAGIVVIAEKLSGQKIGIVGVGGTGSYVLDFVAKTPVAEIHVFDGDDFLNHNAFRAPGAPSLDELRARPTKVGHLCSRYARMHRRIRPHEEYVDDSNIEDLRDLDFVFICVDRGQDRKKLVEQLQAWGRPFVDVGMGVAEVDGRLRGQLRVTASTERRSEHVGCRVPYSDGVVDNEYSRNIQIAELNALNAALAVIKWKKWCGFYLDQDGEHHSIYTIDGNRIDNEDRA